MVQSRTTLMLRAAVSAIASAAVLAGLATFWFAAATVAPGPVSKGDLAAVFQVEGQPATLPVEIAASTLRQP